MEEYLKTKNNEAFHGVSIRPATVCGWSPKPRLDLIVNLLTFHAHFNGEIKILGGERVRPHIHIEDMVNVYLKLSNACGIYLKNTQGITVSIWTN